jgi:hypothetical protein
MSMNHEQAARIPDLTREVTGVGDARTLAPRWQPEGSRNRIDLTAAQKRYLDRLAVQIGRKEEALKQLTATSDKLKVCLENALDLAQEAVDAATAEHERALRNASEYVFVCAEEAEIALGQDGWVFHQPQMAFIREVQEQD